MNIVVIGAGAWGTTLAAQATRKGFNPTIWSYEKEVCEDINLNNRNTRYLPGLELPGGIKSFHESKEITEADLIILAVPSCFLRATAGRWSSSIKSAASVLVATKGIEYGTCMLPSQIVHEAASCSSDKILALSGPNLAREIAAGLPSAAVIAGAETPATAVRDILSGPVFRLYSNDDLPGVQLGGALKNVMAISAGICDGLNIGINAKSALLSRGLAEIVRLGTAMGANPMTFSGLSGMGDLIATSFSKNSRNRAFGEAVARGGNPDKLIQASISAVEGYHTVKPALTLGERLHVSTPIIQKTAEILFDNKSPHEAIQELMTRDLCPELG